MNAEQPSEKFQRLLSRAIDGTASDEELKALGAEMEKHPDLVREYVGARETDNLLRWELGSEQVAPVFRGLSDDATGRGPTDRDANVVNSVFASKWIPWSVAVAASLIALMSLQVVNETLQYPSVDAAGHRPSGPTEFVAALLVDEVEADFETERDISEVVFGPGKYELSKGLVHLRFVNGADLFVQAPAEFRIEDEFHLQLNQGSLRAVVPNTAQGLVVAAPGVDYEDLGTEFGVMVDATSDDSSLHVFTGQVDVHKSGEREVLSSVTEGQAVVWRDGAIDANSRVDPSIFPDRSVLGLKRWTRHRRRLLSDSDLIGYFSFDRQDSERGQAPNESSNETVSDGVVQGARAVTGRWPGKGALLFDRDDDHVQLNLPTDLEELTYTAWIWIDRLDNPMSAILNSDGWGGRKVHWQINGNGAMWIARAGRKPYITSPEIVPEGQWVHLAAAVRRSDGHTWEWINGRLVNRRIFPAGIPIGPGRCRIGSWNPLGSPQPFDRPNRALRGRIDELTIWRRVLTDQEIAEHVDRGRPSALWSSAAQYPRLSAKARKQRGK